MGKPTSLYNRVSSILHTHAQQEGLYVIGSINTLVLVFIGSIVMHMFLLFGSNYTQAILSGSIVWSVSILLMYSVSHRYGSSSQKTRDYSLIILLTFSMILVSFPSAIIEFSDMFSEVETFLVSLLSVSIIIGAASSLLFYIR